jgi:outer membrane protein assembly factor BamB
MKHVFPALLGLALLAPLLPAHGEDWPQWRGPQRNDVSAETGLLKEWPPEGPKQLWVFKNAGNGYSGPAIVGGKLFTLGTRDGGEVLLALDATTGQELWATPLGKVLENKWGGGPRGTPSVDGDRVYALSGPGTLACVQVADGKIVWSRTMEELGGKEPSWGYTESVLVDGEQVVCTPGGSQGTVAALDKKTGKTLWQSKEWTSPAQYSSMVPAKINGEAQYVQLVMDSFAGISPKDGKVLWNVPFPGRTAVIPTPVVKDNFVFITAGYKVGSKLTEIKAGNQPTEIYRNNTMSNHHGGVILVGDHLYGHSDSKEIGWLCMEFATGKEIWKEAGKLGKGAIGYADGMLYCVDENNGTVVLIEASPKGWSEKGRFKLDPQTAIRSRDGRVWTHPVIANGKLYLRDQDLIHCYAVK